MNKFDNNKLNNEIEILKSISSPEEQYTINEFHEICKLINKSIHAGVIVNTIKDYYDTGILSPLKLDDDEFPFTGEINRTNSRCSNLYLNADNDIVYTNAWKPNVVHVYDFINQVEVPIFPTYIDIVECNGPLWITRGGCCTGEYISQITLKKQTIDRHCYIPHPPINIPVSVILNDKENIFSVDCREPRLKTLRQFYDTKELKAEFKFDIRKFKKLDKK